MNRRGGVVSLAEPKKEKKRKENTTQSEPVGAKRPAALSRAREGEGGKKHTLARWGKKRKTETKTPKRREKRIHSVQKIHRKHPLYLSQKKKAI